MSRRSNAGGLRVALLTITVVIAALTLSVGYALTYPNTLIPLASYLTEALTGRALVIDGDLALEISMQPRATASEVRFGNADWSSKPVMAQARFVSVQIDLNALFDRRVHLLDLDVRDGRLHLEDQVDGRPNWIIFQSESDESSEWSFLIESMEFEDIDVHIEIGELEPALLEISELTESSGPAGNLQLDGHGQLNSDRWELNGTIGPLQALLDAGHIELDLDLTVGDAEFEVAGSIGELATLSGLDLQLSAYGPDAHLVGEIFRMPEAFLGEIAFTAKLKPTAAGHSVDIRGHVSEFQVSTTANVIDLNNLDGWDANFDLRGPDADVFGKALQIRGLPDGPFEVSGQLHWHGGDLDLSEVAISTTDVDLMLNADFADFPHREGAFGNIHLSGQDISQFKELLRTPNLPNAAFDLSLNLDVSGNKITATLNVGSHKLTATGKVGEFPEFIGTRLDVSLAGQELAQILSLANIQDSLSGAYQISTLVTLDADGISGSDISFNSGPLQLTGIANLPDFNAPETFSLSGELNVRSLAEIGTQLDLDSLPAAPLKLQAAIRSDRQGYHLESSTISYESLRGSVEGKLGQLNTLRGLDLDIALRGSDIEDLFDDAIRDDMTKIPFELSTRIRGLDEAIELIDFELQGRGGNITAAGRLSLTEDYVGSRFSVTGSGQNLSAIVPAFERYRPPAAPWELEVDFELPEVRSLQVARSSFDVGSVNVALEGTVDFSDQTRTDLLFKATGGSFRDLGRPGEELWPDLPFDITTKLNGNLDTLNVTSLVAHWGDSDLTVSGSIDLADKPDIVLQGRSSTMIVYDLQKALFGEPDEADATEPKAANARIIPDTRIPIEELEAFNANIDIEIDKFRGRLNNLDDLRLRFVVEDGVLKLEEAAYRDTFGSFGATATLKPDGDQVSLDLTLTGDDADFEFLNAQDQPPETIPRYTLDVAISGTGATVAELAGSINGRVLIHSDGGNISNALLDAFAGDFLSNVLDMLNPFVESEPFTNMRCLVINAAITDGVIELEPGFVMRTDKVNMFVFGKANLKSEKLDLSLATQARKGIGISAATITNPYFKIGGTFASPALQIDPASAAIAASLATATAGLSIVIRGLWGRLMGERDPCPHFLNYERKPPEVKK